ncbi:hypothetical protein STAQ_26790 [Allostella sp. ATCC 35155]|nr:hypothetical protein STAQ_26790 [Stella sp. ATCC 35155]
MRTYSPFFVTLYDQADPVGNFGRGLHYTVLQATSWHIPHGGVSERPHLHSFAVIWDEDHDERVIAPIEEIYLSGKLSRFMFFSERKGMFTATLGPNILIPKDSPKLIEEIENIVHNSAHGDWWHVEIDQHIDKPRTLSQSWVFLENIRMVWRLGGCPIPVRGATLPTEPAT